MVLSSLSPRFPEKFGLRRLKCGLKSGLISNTIFGRRFNFRQQKGGGGAHYGCGKTYNQLSAALANNLEAYLSFCPKLSCRMTPCSFYNSINSPYIHWVGETILRSFLLVYHLSFQNAQYQPCWI